MPKVSIVLPTYNGEKYLAESIESIVEQTFTDWELIIVDDCSSDRTYDIAKEYAKSDIRIHVVHNTENQKLPRSLNIGFDMARGKYLTWTSDDNMYQKDAIAVMAERLNKENDVFMVCADMQIIDEIGRITGRAETYSNEKIYAFNCVGACFMYKREVYERIGGYDADAFCVEDYDYWLRIIQTFGRILPIHQSLYLYRRHGKSLSVTKRKQVEDQLTKLRIKYIDELLKQLYKNKNELCRIYYEMRQSYYMTERIKEKFKNKLPELQGDVPLGDDRKYIIFGAGSYGEKAAAMLGEKAVFFADNDLTKRGKRKSGLKILSFQEAVAQAENYHFIISVSGIKIYELIVQLLEAGIREYCVFIPDK